MSPEVGELDEAAFDEAMANDPDAALALLADLTGATDEKLRALAKQLAGRILVDLAKQGPAIRRGMGRLQRQRYQPDGGDLDLDASLDAIAVARATRAVPDPDDLRVIGWSKRDTAYCLVVDRSGSMNGAPLATSAVSAAAVAWRAGRDYSVIAFSNDAVVAKGQESDKPVDRVITDVLSLRGHGTTDVALALRAAAEQLARSTAARRVVVLLSDCRSTVPGDVVAAAAALDELVIIAPEGDSAEAEALGRAAGARVATVAGPSSIPAAMARVLES